MSKQNSYDEAAFANKLKEWLSYDPETGELRWLKGRSKAKAGELAGTKCPRGYVRITFEGKKYAAHRLAWLLAHGTWPSESLDHIDGDRGNNRISNLRECSNSENHQNRRKYRGSSKYLGVSWNRRKRKWQATIMVDFKSKHLGYFDGELDAYSAYLDAKKELHPFNPKARCA